MDLSVIAMIGIILLIGIVKKNGIMLVDFALEVERTEGLTPRGVDLSGLRLRFRPILMTTMAALLGGVPLMLGAGAGSEIRQPLGYAIVGGLLLSQVLTLYTTPWSISISIGWALSSAVCGEDGLRPSTSPANEWWPSCGWAALEFIRGLMAAREVTAAPLARSAVARAVVVCALCSPGQPQWSWARHVRQE